MGSYLMELSYFPPSGVNVPGQRDLLLLSTDEKNFDLESGVQGEARLLGHYDP